MNQFMGVMTDPFVAGRGDGFGAHGRRADDAAMPRTASRRGAASATPMRDVRKAPRRCRSNRAGACGRRAMAVRRPPTAMRRSARTTRPASIYGTAVGADYRFSPDTLAGFALAGGGTSFSVAGSGSGHSDLFQAGAFVRHNAGPAYISGGAGLWLAGHHHQPHRHRRRHRSVAGAFNANAFSGRVEGGYRFVAPWIGRHRHHALCRRTVHHLRSAGLCRTGAGRQQRVRAGLRRQERDRHAQELGIRTDKSFAHAGRDPDAARPSGLGA